MKPYLFPTVLICTLPLLCLAETSPNPLTETSSVRKQAAPQLNQTSDFPTVFVTASRLSADAIDTDFQTSSVTVISQEQFDTKVATVADVLKKEAGIQIRQSGGLGSFSTVNIRGSSANQVNVYLDGVLLNGAFGGSVDLSQFALGNVEKIEIYRGNAPVQLGYSGIGGAINIKTRKLSGDAVKQLTLGAGSYESKKIATTVGDQIQGTDVLLSAEYLASDNDFSRLNTNGTPDNTRDDVVENQNNADFSHTSALLSLSRPLGESNNLQFIGQYFNKRDHLSDVFNTESNRAFLETDFINGQLKLDYFYRPGISHSLKLFGSKKAEFYEDNQSRIGLRDNKEEGITTTLGGGVQSAVNLNNHLVNINIETKVERYTLEDFNRDTFFKYQRTQTLLGLQDEWVSQDGAWLVTVSGRLFHLSDDIKQQSKNNSDWHHGVSAGVLYTFNPVVQFRANISHDIRLPQLFELYGDRGYFIGNEELVPESALNLDAGVSITSKQSKSTAAVFYRSLDDAIVNSFGSQGVGQATNIGKARIAGLEFESNYQINKLWSFLIKSTYQDSENLASGNDLNGNALAGLYRLSSFASTSILQDQLLYTLEYSHQSGGFYDNSNDAAIPKQNLINLSTKWQGQQSSVEVRLDNIADKNVQDFNRFPMPGRRLFIVYKQNF